MSNTPRPTSPEAENYQIRQILADLTLRISRVEQRLGIESTPARPQPQPTAPPSIIQPATKPVPPPPVPAVPVPQASVPQVPAPSSFPVSSPLPDVVETMPEQHSASADEPYSSPPASNIAMDWENLIGGKWALWIGSISMFLAIASFLAYTWRFMPPPPPGAKVAMGIAAGIAAIIAGAYSRERTQRWFSEGLFGAGLGVLYLSIWAAAQSFHLIGFGTAFLLLALITTAGVYLAVRYDAVSLITLATIGGFLTPLLLQSDGNTGSAVPFLTYVAVLNAGILAVSVFKKWRGIVWLSFVATLLVVGGWAIDSYASEFRWPTFTFVTVYFLLFLGASCFYSLVHREQTAHEDLLLLFAAASVYAIAGFALVQAPLGAYPGVFPVALALFFALLCRATRVLVPDNLTLRDSTGGLGLLSLTIAIPIQLKQEWLAIGWNAEAAVLLLLSSRLRSPMLQRAGQIIWLLSLGVLLLLISEVHPTSKILFFNEAALPIVFSIATGALLTANFIVLRNNKDDWSDALASYYTAYAVIAGAWLIAQEAKLGFTLWHPGAVKGWQTNGAFIVACLWSIYALAVFHIGLRYRHLVLRFSALSVAMLAATLPLWFGTTQVNAEWAPFWNMRWLSYVVVGVTLALLGWMVSREQSAMEPEEADALTYWPAGTALFMLAGMTTEVYSGFSHLHGHWQHSAFYAIAILWSVYSTLILMLGYAWRQSSLRAIAYGIGGIGIALLLCNVCSESSVTTPLFNLRFMAFAVVLATLSIVSFITNRQQSAHTSTETTALAALRLLSTLVLLWGLTQEAYETCHYFHKVLGPQWDRWGQMTVSVLWSLYGTLLLIGGISRRQQSIRLAGLGLLGLTVLKVFLFDLSFLDTSLRILSLGGLGAALIFISWLYSRFGIENKATA